MNMLKIKIFRNGSTDSQLESDVNNFIKSKSREKIISINYLATSTNGHISVIVEYLEK